MKQLKLATQLLVGTVLAVVHPSEGYELATHGALTREALMQSQLNPGAQELLLRLGISDRQVSLGSFYLDIPSSAAASVRSNSPGGPGDNPYFGIQKINDANFGSAFKPTIDSLPGWLMFGAVREDDVPYDNGALENNPQDDPGADFSRVLNHFYDPYNDRALTVGLLTLGLRAPDWAIQADDTLVGPGDGVPPPRGNHFSVTSAREAMWRALTLKMAPSTSDQLADVQFAATSTIPTREALRMAYWATTFRSLGDAVHLLQDMAQPQHTRNDPHSGRYCSILSNNCPGGHASYYEHYVDALVAKKPSFTLRQRFFFFNDHQDFVENVKGGAPNFGGYPIARFSSYRDYFITKINAASLSGLGLANYSNQGFYSTGTNIGADASKFGSPPADGSGQSFTNLQAGQVLNANGVQVVAGTLTLRTGNVSDNLNSTYSATNVALSAVGMFDQFLQAKNKSQYSLNHYNYDDQLKLLLPRAVAYSAGLVDYFFRGKMEISLPDEGVYGIVDHSQFAPPQLATDQLYGTKGFGTIRLRLANTTDAIKTPDGSTVPQAMANGALVAVLKFHRNRCYLDNLDGEVTDLSKVTGCRTPDEEIVVSKLLRPASVVTTGESPNGTEFTFEFPSQLPINAWDVVLQVVYRGPLGGEADAVVVATKDISEPTFITTHNDTDLILVGGACVPPATVASKDELWNQLGPACQSTANGTRVVSNACVNVPLNVALTGTSSAKPVSVAMQQSGVGDTRIPPGRFGRFAILTDAATVTNMALGFNNPPLYLPAAQTQPQYPANGTQRTNVVTFVNNAYQSDISTKSSNYITHRGVKLWQGSIIVVDGKTGTVGANCPDPTNNLLQDAARYPSAASILGWQ